MTARNDLQLMTMAFAAWQLHPWAGLGRRGLGRRSDLSLLEEDLIKDGQHVLVTYIMKPKDGFDYLATAAHYAAELSTGIDAPTIAPRQETDAWVYFVDPSKEEMRIAYPNVLFVKDGRPLASSALSLIGAEANDVECDRVSDIFLPPSFMRHFDGPSCKVAAHGGGLVVGTIIPPRGLGRDEVRGLGRTGAFAEAIRRAEARFDGEMRALAKEEAKISAEMERAASAGSASAGFKDELARFRQRIQETRRKHAAAKEKAVLDAKRAFFPE